MHLPGHLAGQALRLSAVAGDNDDFTAAGMMAAVVGPTAEDFVKCA